MKHSFTSAIFILFFFTASFGQSKQNYVELNSQIIGKDTTYSFGLHYKDLDNIREQLLYYWKTPLENTASRIVWNDKVIENVGSKLKIVLIDWLCTDKEKSTRCEVFKNQNDKIRKIKNIKPNQYRSLEITITDDSGKNVIHSKEKANYVLQQISEIFGNK